MKKLASILVIFLLSALLLAPKTWATPTELSTAQEITQPSPTPQPTETPTRKTSPQNQNPQAQTNTQWMKHLDSFQALQGQVTSLENQLSQFTGTDPRMINWLNSWWQIGFWTGVLWLFPWIFVGWQWTRLKFWGFSWPWPWWFWIPLLWWIPWLIIGWQWWLALWPWWTWIWWFWPWIFWPFWWVIVFKELTISLWHRRHGDKTTPTL